MQLLPDAGREKPEGVKKTHTGLIFTHYIQIFEFTLQHWISYPALIFIYFRYFPLFSKGDVQNNCNNPIHLGSGLGRIHACPLCYWEKL